MIIVLFGVVLLSVVVIPGALAGVDSYSKVDSTKKIFILIAKFLVYSCQMLSFVYLLLGNLRIRKLIFNNHSLRRQVDTRMMTFSVLLVSFTLLLYVGLQITMIVINV